MLDLIMKAVILAGGLGARISEETDVKPKPMIEVGGRRSFAEIHYGEDMLLARWDAVFDSLGFSFPKPLSI